MRKIYIIAHDMRSTFNVGSLLRTAEGMGVNKVYLTGYTPYPRIVNDPRLPHVQNKLHAQISKVALGAEELQSFEFRPDINELINQLKADGITVIALEQTNQAVPLPEFQAPDKIALVLGTEVTGLPPNVLSKLDTHVIIPMFGKKESFNVVQAAAMALYQLRFR